MRRDYYAVLGVRIAASPREIRQAYRRLARQYSPDVNFWEREARGLFEEISEAYRILNDPGARSLYDRFGHRAFRRQAGEVSGQRGDDLYVPVELSFADAARGVGLTVSVERLRPCPECAGAGCPACRDRGLQPETAEVPVAIPPGVDTGAQIRVPGEGHAGPFGGPRGDLIVIARVGEHPFFVRKGDNVHCELPVTLGEAVLGARIRVPTLDGEAALVLPPGTQSGQVFRLRGRGMRRLHGDDTGDLYVSVRVTIPRGLDERTQAIFREVERLLPETPRAGYERFRGGAV
ncbi:MAG: DnaJ domain-containing protein [Candidatus Rokubacteria bacterium]|nr:DnaJ domain-containing protein [Candidatus Rokubacteria bacterium]